MKGRCLLYLISAAFLLVCATADKRSPHKLVKRQLFPRASAQRSFPLSRSRQFPPPEELEDVEAVDENEDVVKENEPPPPVRRYSSQFRGRQQPPEGNEDAIEDYSYTEAPPTTVASTTKPPNRIPAFNRVNSRPRFGASAATTSRTTSPSRTRSRSRLTSAPAQRIDVASEILNRPPPPRQPTSNTSGFRTTTSRNSGRKPVLEETSSSSTIATRRVGSGGRTRARGRLRTRTSTTTTTTTTTTPAPPAEDYYYYYYDDEEEVKQPLATTTSTTTTTTTKPPSLARRPSFGRGRVSNTRTSTTARAALKFDPESQFQPPPEDLSDTETTRQTKKFTTSTTTTPPPGVIPPHLRSKYKPRTDGRFIDYYRDPNRPRELKGFDLTDYPFYIKVPDDIVFDCEDKKDGYYASVPHHCQLFHYCFAGSRYDFLCANYTLYDQTTFTCRFANNVDCPSSEKYYYRNDDLWKETTTMPPEEQKKKKVTKDSDYEEEDEDYEDEDYEDDYDEEEDRRRRRPARRRRNRRRKNRRKPSS